jgi:hypothetical protein
MRFTCAVTDPAGLLEARGARFGDASLEGRREADAAGNGAVDEAMELAGIELLRVLGRAADLRRVRQALQNSIPTQ